LASWMLSLRNRMACPDISTLLTPELPKLVQVSVKTSVRDVVRRMRDHGTTAALVMDHDNLAGIFCVGTCCRKIQGT
jgi:signal-transduction protein with cAMP-binding, CBS, and nucleotidyltransferase domain